MKRIASELLKVTGESSKVKAELLKSQDAIRLLRVRAGKAGPSILVGGKAQATASASAGLPVDSAEVKHLMDRIQSLEKDNNELLQSIAQAAMQQPQVAAVAASSVQGATAETLSGSTVTAEVGMKPIQVGAFPSVMPVAVKSGSAGAVSGAVKGMGAGATSSHFRAVPDSEPNTPGGANSFRIGAFHGRQTEPGGSDGGAAHGWSDGGASVMSNGSSLSRGGSGIAFWEENKRLQAKVESLR